jgi:uncharacterized protein (DUF433 family)
VRPRRIVIYRTQRIGYAPIVYADEERAIGPSVNRMVEEFPDLPRQDVQECCVVIAVLLDEIAHPEPPRPRHPKCRC